MSEVRDELWPLLNALCEHRLTPTEAARLEQLVLSSPEARRQYVDYLNLHGSLYWDAVGGLALIPAAESSATTTPRRTWRWLVGAIASGLAAMLLIGVVWRTAFTPPHGGSNEIAVNPVDNADPVQSPTTLPHVGPREPVRLKSHDAGTPEIAHHEEQIPGVAPERDDPPSLTLDPNLPANVQRPVALINHRLAAGWTAAEVSPSERADDDAWLRRVYLDLTGRIPTAAAVQSFLSNKRTDKRRKIVDQLLDSPEYARNLTTQWTNLLVGRVSAQQVDRNALQKFLRTSFAQNRGWDDIVSDLVAAEGRADQNGAANYLIAHLNNQAVPATAITARLFLGEQVQCTQCHKHPFGEGTQTDFWELNSFFHQTEAVTVIERDPKTGSVKSSVAELVSQPTGGATFYETRDGVMKAAYPRYDGREISAEPDVNRRQELARLMVEDDELKLARAFVNRTWQHLFGFGFTRPVDDMGPHNPPSHPELLADLAREFRNADYDVKQLTRWICLSDAYQLSSRMTDENQVDDPERGETPLFSRVYPRPLSAEQLYDSFLVATKAHQSGAADWTEAESQRQAWLAQFIVTFNTEENDEANTFDGTVAQALTMMNGPLIAKALEPTAGTYLGQVLRQPATDTQKIEQLCLAALSRKPNPRELAAMHKLVRKSPSESEGYQDLFWALLNSNEFSATY